MKQKLQINRLWLVVALVPGLLCATYLPAQTQDESTLPPTGGDWFLVEAMTLGEYQTGNNTDRFQFDAAGNSTNDFKQASQDAAFQLTNGLSTAYTARSDVTNQIRFQYDVAGHLTNETQTIWDDAPRSIGSESNVAGAGTKLRYPDGSVVPYEYNANEWVTNTGDGGTTTIVGYEYDAAGRRTKRTLQNSTFTVLEYDRKGIGQNGVGQ